MRVVEAVEDTTVCDGKYAFHKGDRIGLLACRTQTDPKVWGEDVSSALFGHVLNAELAILVERIQA